MPAVVRSDANGNVVLPARAVLAGLPDQRWSRHGELGLRHPLGTYNTSVAVVAKRVTRVISLLRAVVPETNSGHTESPEQVDALLESQEALLQGLMQHSAQMPVARCAPRARRHEGSRWSTGGASHLRRRAPHRWRRNHHRDQRREAATTGTRGAPVSAEILWPEGPGTAITARRFTRDNWNYRAQKSVPRQVGTARAYHAVTRIRNHRRS